ncbi:MAG TPA: D-alanyl-D-alanine carboxypeptidase, partial [Rhodocyclaceae bacterium]|nr:D-alanyl-D-alanine carboxypeptidase [Rhodocyclaceae bacterium]
ESLDRLLQDAWKSPVMPELVSSLPIVGIDGTMKKRLKESSASGRAHVKTGTLDGVKTAAGYALDSQGRRYVVVFLINHPKAQAGGPAIDALLLWVAQRQAGELPPILEAD